MKRINTMYFWWHCSVAKLCLWAHGLQHSRLPCPPLSPGVCSDSYPLSQWCHPTISSPVVPFSSCPQSFPTLGSFAMSQLFASGGQSVGASALASVLPMNIQDWFLVGLTCLILHSKGLSSLLQHHSSKHSQFKSISFKCVSCSNLFVTWNYKSRLYLFWRP